MTRAKSFSFESSPGEKLQLRPPHSAINYPKRSCTHRMKGHDYRATWKYHLTLLKNPDAPYFCHLADG